VPRSEILQPGSNTKVESLSQSEKHAWEMISVDAGMEIDSSHRHFENADSPSTESAEPDSKVKSRNIRQPLKHDFEMISTDEGMQID
jgi:hypothetical protein